MNDTLRNPHVPPGKRRYLWPWLVAAALVLGIALAIIWMSHETERIRRNRELNAPMSPGR